MKKEFMILVDLAAGYGRIVPDESGDVNQRFHESPLEWGLGMPDSSPDENGIAVFHSRLAAKYALKKMFPIRFVVTQNVGEGSVSIHELRMGAYRSGVYFGPHETYCADFLTREEAEKCAASLREK